MTLDYGLPSSAKPLPPGQWCAQRSRLGDALAFAAAYAMLACVNCGEFIVRFILSAVLLLTAPIAQAFDIETMSDAERDIFRAEIRDYLLENPEVLMEAIAVLEERREAESAVADIHLIEQHRSAIFDDGYSYIGGNPDGDVTVVEFLDYRCGYCKRAFPAVEELLASDGNIRLVLLRALGEAFVTADYDPDKLRQTLS